MHNCTCLCCAYLGLCYSTGSVIEKLHSSIVEKKKRIYIGTKPTIIVFIAVAMNTDGFFSYLCIRFIFFMIELRIFSMTEPVLYYPGADSGGGGGGGGEIKSVILPRNEAIERAKQLYRM